MILIVNPVHFLLDFFYQSKYVKFKKRFEFKNINFFISHTLRRTDKNKKYKKLMPIFNPICSLYFKKNICSIKKFELEEILDLIDNDEFDIKPRMFHLNSYYKSEPMSSDEFFSLTKYNFYDLLIFDYVRHRDREKTITEYEKYEDDRLQVRFK